MKQILLFITAIFIFISSSSGQSTHYRLDSMVSDGFKAYYYYDSLNRKIEQQQFYYAGRQWVEGNHIFYSYNTANQLILEEEKKYIDSTSSFENRFKKEYTWEGGKNTLRKEFNYVDDGYIKRDSIIFNYDADLLESDTTFDYDTSSNYWNYEELVQYSYDTEDNLIREEKSDFETISWGETNLYKYYYNSDGLIGKSRSGYDSMHEEWNVDDSTSYEYSQSYIDTALRYEYIDSTDSWKNFERTTFHQDYSVSSELILYPLQPINADLGISVFNYTSKIDSLVGSNWDEASASWNDYIKIFFYYTPFTGIEKNEIIEVELFPNPAQSKIFIRAKARLKNYQIFDIQGKLIKGGTIKSKEAEINVSGLRSGTYIIQAFDKENNVIHRNFIKR